MADKRAYTVNVNPRGSGSGEDGSVHQSHPSWVLTFVRWENRDTLRNTSVSSVAVRDPLVVENDCLQVAVTVNKGNLTPSMVATLVMTDVNYETAIAPGDFVFVNMLNWPSDSRRVADAARAKGAINGTKDGFKGIFKVQGVRRVVSTDTNTGTKTVLFKVTGYAFTEFNNTIYFNPFLIDPNQDPKNQLLFASYLGRDWQKIVNDKGLTNVQDIISVLIQSFIGSGINDEGRLEKDGTVKSANVHFFMPELVGKLLGVRGVKAAKDIYDFIFGIQRYAGGSGADLKVGLNPVGLTKKFGRCWYTQTPCPGDSLLKAEYWNQVKAWAIINQYTNSPINEIYTCFRVSPTGKVMPTMVFRQIPFTTEDFAGTKDVTKFLTLPRWSINPAMVINQELGREEAARINFVQYFGRSSLGVNGADISQQIAQGNYVYDIQDVQRSGLRPYIVSTQFDEPTTTNKEYRSPSWAKIVGDALVGGHLKFNGTLECAGIVEPVAVGDNVEFDNIVYHVESVSHVCSIDIGSGRKIFRTTLSLSSGVHISSSNKGTRYAEMDHTNAESLRKSDFKNEDILPGVSESQDVVYRPENPDSPSSPNKPFPQPGVALPNSQKKKGKK